MKITAENPETNERFEAEIVDLNQDDLKNLETLHFPGNKNPEKTVRKYIENQNIPADQKAGIWKKLQKFARVTLWIGKKTVLIGRKMFDFVLYLAKNYPRTTIGVALGAVVASLVAAIPVLGFVFGGLAAVILPLIGGILGYKEDLGAKGYKSRFFDAINDPEMKDAIEKEVRGYGPLNSRSGSSGQKGSM